MKKVVLIALILISAPALASTVNGYYRNDGTYVQPYQRSVPNQSPYDNYGYYNSRNPNKYIEDYYNR